MSLIERLRNDEVRQTMSDGPDPLCYAAAAELEANAAEIGRLREALEEARKLVNACYDFDDYLGELARKLAPLINALNKQESGNAGS